MICITKNRASGRKMAVRGIFYTQIENYDIIT